MKTDYHMHTSFSRDSFYPMEEEIKCAIEHGLEEICFTEHVDHLIHIPNSDANLEAYYQMYLKMKEKYAHQIQIKFGIEFGIQPHTVDLFQKDFDTYNFDFVILSCHQIDDQELWTQEYQQGRSQHEINMNYYETIYQCMNLYHDYSVLGHLDAIKRDDPFGEYADEKVMDIIDKILRKVIEDGKGIEVNTSNFRYHLHDLTPSKTILKRYYDLGGRILTFGSDTHAKEHVAYQIEEVKKIVKEIGFTHFCTYDKMKCVFYEL
ncbi:MAG: histidinol-phosphatase HisJ family protein [Traorella sp.]